MITWLCRIVNLILLLCIALTTSATMDFKAMLASAKRAEKARSKAAAATSDDAQFKFSDLRSHGFPSYGVSFSRNVFAYECGLQSILEAELENRGRQTTFEDMGGRRVWMIGGVPHPSGAILTGLPTWAKQLAESLRPVFGGEAPNQILVNVYEVGMGIKKHNDGALYESTAAILTVGGSALLEFTANGKHNKYLVDAPLAAGEAAAGAGISSSTVDGSSSTGNAAEGSVLDPAQSARAAALTAFSVYLPANSLIVFSNNAYERYDHGIAARIDDSIDSSCINADACDLTIPQTIPRSTRRFSLTFRRVKLVAKVVDEEFGVCSADEQEEIDRRFHWWKKSISD